MSIKIERIRNIISTIIFLVIVIGGFIMHYDEFKLDFEESYLDASFGNISEINSSMDRKIKESLQIELKRELSNIMGIFYKATNVDVIGNFEYYTNGDYILYFGKTLSTKTYPDVFRELQELKKISEIYDIELLYIQAPQTFYEHIHNVDPYVASVLNIEPRASELADGIEKIGIPYVDMGQNLDSIEELNVTDTPYYYRYKTDGHPTTSTSWWAVKYLVEYMGIDAQEMLDWNSYEIVKNAFLGGNARNVGEYFVELDEFIRLYPKFDTAFTKTYYNSTNSYTGTFDEIVMSGYPKDGDCYNYFVTDYLHYGADCVCYDNLLNEDGTNVLFICDSFGFQTGAYLSLFVDKLTFVDPRFDGKIHNLPLSEYDYIFVMSRSGLYADYVLGVCDKEGCEITGVEKNEELLEVYVKNTGEVVWNSENLVRLCLYIDGADTGCRWGIDGDINVKPGEEYVFEVDISEFELSQEQSYSFGMLQEGWLYFDNIFEVNDILFEETEIIY